MNEAIDLENLDQALSVPESTKPQTTGGSFLEKIDRGKHLIFLLDASGSMEDRMPNADGNVDWNNEYVEVTMGGGDAPQSIGRRGRGRRRFAPDGFSRRILKSCRYNVMCEVLDQIVQDRWDKSEHPKVSLVVFDSEIAVSKVCADRAEIVPAAQASFTKGGTAVMAALNHAIRNVVSQVPDATYHHIVAITDGSSTDMVDMREQNLWDLAYSLYPPNPDGTRARNVSVEPIKALLPQTALMRWAQEVHAMPQTVKLDWIRIGSESMGYRGPAIDVSTLTTLDDPFNATEYAMMMVPRMACEMLGGLYETVETREAAQTRVLEQATRLALPPAQGA